MPAAPGIFVSVRKSHLCVSLRLCARSKRAVAHAARGRDGRQEGCEIEDFQIYGKRIGGLREAGWAFKPTKPTTGPQRLKRLKRLCVFFTFCTHATPHSPSAYTYLIYNIINN